MAVRHISRPHVQMTVVEIQVHFQNEGAVYQYNIWKQSGCHVQVWQHLVKVTCTELLNNSNIIPKVFSFVFFSSFLPLPLCLLSLKLECYSRHKNHEVITYSQAQMWG